MISLLFNKHTNNICICKTDPTLILSLSVKNRESMGEHLVVMVDQLDKPNVSEAALQHQGDEVESQYTELAGQSSSPKIVEKKDKAKTVMKVDEEEAASEVAKLIGMAECRICHEEDYPKNLENPCACSGSVKYAHRNCVQHWCNEKGDITCEICHQTYQPGYTAPPRPEPGETVIDIGGGWQISGRPINLHDPRMLAVNEVEQRLLEAASGDDDDYSAANSGAVFCRSAALIIMALLLMHNVFSLTDDDSDDDDVTAIFSLFLLRAIGFLLPCYIMIWAISILQRRRQRQEAAALARSRFAFVVQSGQSGLHFAISETARAPEPAPVRTLASVPVVTPRAERM